MPIPRKPMYLTLTDLAKHWDCNKDEVLHLVETYTLAPSVKFDGKCTFQFLNESGEWEAIKDINGDDDLDDFGALLWKLNFNDTDSPTGSWILNIPTTEIKKYWSQDRMTESWENYLAPMHIPIPEKLAGKNLRVLPESFKVEADSLLFMMDEIIRFETESNINPTPTQRQSDSTRAITTLQKILIGIAIDAYGYAPNTKGTTVNDIQRALDAVGLTVSENTIRSHLKAGADLIDQNNQ